jgi:hypothetical protein
MAASAFCEIRALTNGAEAAMMKENSQGKGVLFHDI